MSFPLSLRIGATILAIRTVVGVLIGVPIPGRTLFTIPILHLPSWMPGIRIGGAVTLERLSSSLHEGIIIATLIALFGAATSLTSPHKLLRVTPSFIYEIGITLVIATSLFPQLATGVRRIRTAQRLRGIEKVKLGSIALPLLEEALARSLQLAASMDSRGYGVSRKRSRYRPQQWLARDSAFILLTGLLTLVMVAQRLPSQMYRFSIRTRQRPFWKISPSRLKKVKWSWLWARLDLVNHRSCDLLMD
jgi:energy-coupling factor transporter transmembrane protein EcfT